jgi:hypothetical protein
MGLKESEDTMAVRSAHFAASHFAGKRGPEFHFYKSANGPLVFFMQRSLRTTAQRFGAVIGGQHTGVDICQ